MEHVALRSSGLPVNKRWLQRGIIAAVLLSFSGVVVWGAMHLVHQAGGSKRQIARIMILPDTPPPPPPPEEKKPPPKEEKITQPINTPKQETPPAPAQLKMEGQAGEGPSAFAAGEVKNEYTVGDIGNGSRYSAYVARFEQRVQAELTRRKLHVTGAKLFVWLAADGSIQRFTVAGTDADSERTLRAALSDLNRADEAPLADMPMPIGLNIN
jgi:protein TonB